MKIKQAILLLFTILFLSCDSPTFTEINLPITDPPPIDDTPITYTLASYDGVNLSLYDGETWTDDYTGTAHYAGYGWITVYDTAYHINSGLSYQLIGTPDAILFDGENFYYTISGVVYKNRELINDFGLIPADDIRIFKTGIYILQDRYWKHIYTGESYFYTLGDNVATVLDDEITIIGDGTYGYTSYTQTVNQWHEFGGQSYSDNGVRYIPNDGIYNNSTPLSEFNAGGSLFDMWTNAGVLYCIGEYIKDSDTKLLWLNLTDGNLYEYSPDLNTLQLSGKIFSGTGDYTSARNKHKTMWSVKLNGHFILPLDGNVVEYDHNSGSVGIFLSGDKLIFGL